MTETIEGLNDLLKKFEQLKNLDLLPALKSGAFVIMAESIENTSHDWPNVITGNLMNSYSVQENDDGGVDIINSAEYAFYLEYGHGNVQPRAMVRRAIASKTEDSLNAIKNNLQNQIDKIT